MYNGDKGVSGVEGMWHGSIRSGGGWGGGARDQWHHCLLHQVQGQQSAGRQVNTRGEGLTLSTQAEQTCRATVS